MTEPKICSTSGRPTDVVRAEQTETKGQYKDYIVLCPDERAKGFIRPYREKYIHVGKEIQRHSNGRLYGRLIREDDSEYRDYVDDKQTEQGYVGFVIFPKDNPCFGRYITQPELEAIVARKTHFGGCGVLTKMGQALSETYARQPSFYGATYCVGCKEHLPVGEFVWEDGEAVGS